MSRVSIDKMNQDIAIWLWGGKFHKLKPKDKEFFLLFNKEKSLRYFKWNFHEDYNLLMKAFEKAAAANGTFPSTKKTIWYAIYPHKEIISTKNWRWRVKSYSCGFTQDNHGRDGYGKKFNKDFQKPTIILAMHYSLWRLIKNGLEY